MNTPHVTMPNFDGRSYNWKHEDTINAIVDGTYVPQSRKEVITLLNERFGCIYHKLPEHFQTDTELATIAAIQSSGYELKRVSEHVRKQLDMKAIEVAIAAYEATAAVGHISAVEPEEPWRAFGGDPQEAEFYRDSAKVMARQE